MLKKLQCYLFLLGGTVSVTGLRLEQNTPTPDSLQQGVLLSHHSHSYHVVIKDDNYSFYLSYIAHLTGINYQLKYFVTFRGVTHCRRERNCLEGISSEKASENGLFQV